MYLITENQEQVDPGKERQLAENPELEPIKKFLLIQKLQELDLKLKEKNILNDSLSTFLSFSEFLTFDTIVAVSNGLVDFIEQQLKGQKNEDQPEG
jgi:hypothetical protein